MSVKDFERFLYKIEQLNKFAELINDSSEKYELVINCNTHEEVVALAREWGFEIGKRWGES